MKKINFILMGISLFLLMGCETIDKTINNHCMTGCFAGMNYNGSEILEIDTENIGEDELKKFVACENFCKVYVNEYKKGNLK